MKSVTRDEKKVFPPHMEDLITKDNWFTSQKNVQWYCQNDELGPSRIIWRGNRQATSLLYAEKGLDLDVFGNEDEESVLDYLKRTNTDAFLVMHKGKIVYENYFNGYKPYQLHAINSATKSFIGLIIGVLWHEGELDLDKKSSFYIPELEGTGLGDGTIQQLMDMQVPVKYMEIDTPMGIGRGTLIFIAAGAMPKPDNYNGPENLYEVMLSSKKDKPSGASFYYENGQTEVLGWIAKRLTGKNIAELIQDTIWFKLGAEENASMQLDPIGTDVANCGMRATLRDLARFGEMMLNYGYYNDQQIIPERIIREIQKGSNKEYFEASDFGYLSGFSYHNQWWVNHDPFDGYSAHGRFDQRIYIAPKADTLIVKLSSYLPQKYETEVFQTITKYLMQQ
ncbi:serine hydrolase domain-containing protein [Aneurinibacillus sp. REN35]|uniref:serine hydrolase domain-containing protein n=1 Tax=Aneurinibacillus sp. REN35 TaxID=3237286 RepID=UPI0035298795